MGVFVGPQLDRNLDPTACCICWNTTTGRCPNDRALFDGRNGAVLAMDRGMVRSRDRGVNETKKPDTAAGLQAQNIAQKVEDTS